MPLPPAIQTVTVNFGPMLDFQGAAMRGETTFTPTVPLLHADTGTIILNRPITVVWDADGMGAVILPATDSAGLNVTGFTYRVAHRTYDSGVPAPESGNVSLPAAAPVVDLDLLVPQTASNGVVVAQPEVISVGGQTGVVTATQLATALDTTGNRLSDAALRAAFVSRNEGGELVIVVDGVETVIDIEAGLTPEEIVADPTVAAAFGASPAVRAERFSVRSQAELDARLAETIPGASVGATSAGGAATAISGGVYVPAAVYDTGALSSLMRFTKSTAIQSGPAYPHNESVKFSGIDSTNGSLDLAVEFIYSGATFEVIWLGMGTTKSYRVWADGLIVGTWAGVASDGSIRRNLVTFPDARPRLVRIEMLAGGSFRGITREAAATVSYPTTKPKGPRMIVAGDSYTEGAGAATAQESFVYLLGEHMGWIDTWRSGSGGTGYLNPGLDGRKKLRDRAATDIVAPAPNVVVVAAGINDHGGYTASAIGTEAGLLYDQILAGLPNVELIVVGPWWPKGGPTAAIPATVLAARDAIQAEAVERGLYFIDPIAEEWITGTGRVGAPAGDGNADIYISSDGTHPTSAGHAYLARRLAGHLRTLGAIAA